MLLRVVGSKYELVLFSWANHCQLLPPGSYSNGFDPSVKPRQRTTIGSIRCILKSVKTTKTARYIFKLDVITYLYTAVQLCM